MNPGFDFVATSNVGLIRSGNEDAGLGSTRLLAVADGMGGHAAGEVASATVVNSLYVGLTDLPSDVEAAQVWLEENIQAAHDRLGEIVAENPETRGMGTTLSAVLYADGQALIGHIGDSRIYRLRSGEFTQLTKDHTYVQMLVDNGEITPAEAERHPRRNLMIRAIDGIHELNLDMQIVDLQIGDRFLVCSDGLSGVISDSRLAEVITDSDMTRASAQLIDYAIAAGAPDNVTLVLAEYRHNVETDLAFMVGSPTENSLPVIDTEPIKTKKSLLPYIGAVGLAAVVLLAGFVGWWNQQWYVGIAENNVAIYHGIPQDLFGIELSSVDFVSDISLTELSEIDSALLIRGIVVADLASANALIADLSSRTIEMCDPGTTEC